VTACKCQLRRVAKTMWKLLGRCVGDILCSYPVFVLSVTLVYLRRKTTEKKS
jgi:hypothetical protein